MNLFDYTKILAEKIKFYDSIAQNPFFDIKNPFSEPLSFTIIWIEDSE